MQANDRYRHHGDGATGGHPVRRARPGDRRARRPARLPPRHDHAGRRSGDRRAVGSRAPAATGCQRLGGRRRRRGPRRHGVPRPAPGRLGGRFIASHITIPAGGPVPDYVHYHDVRYQSIHCVRGWVRVVYEDQGPPFVLEAGDCVLQPPGIRHRVLESSPGLEVVEVGSPAAHPTSRRPRVAAADDGRASGANVRRAAVRPPPCVGGDAAAVASRRLRVHRHRDRRRDRRARRCPDRALDQCWLVHGTVVARR